MKYIELITNAYRLRNVIDRIQAPSAIQGRDAVLLLNQLMAELKVDGCDLQYIPITVAQQNDDLTIPAWAEGGITAALAVRLAAGAAVTPELTKQLEDGMRTIENKCMHAHFDEPTSFAHVPPGEAQRTRGDFFNS